MIQIGNKNAIQIHTDHGYTIASEANLNSLSTFVLLEQERWFEKEVDFVANYIKPGMTVVDIGANLGVYSLLCASSMKGEGQVFSYEPNPDISCLLRFSSEANKLTNITVCELALSNEKGQTCLSMDCPPEASSINTSGDGILVEMTSLDEEMETRSWQRIDFLKIDAEGVEDKIIDGAKKFFSKFSPLILIEVANSGQRSYVAAKMLEQLGYRIFRQLSALPVLVPFDYSDVDLCEINVFAVPQDSQASLQSLGMLIKTVPKWRETKSDVTTSENFWRNQKHIRELPIKKSGSKNTDYLCAMTAYACWTDERRNLATRIGALFFALQTLRALCAEQANLSRLVSLARIAADWGLRAEAFEAVAKSLALISVHGEPRLDEFFCAPFAEFEKLSPRGCLKEWVATALMEQERNMVAYSWCMVPNAFERLSDLRFIETKKFCSVRTSRTRVLLEGAQNTPVDIPEILKASSESHLNADLWKSGLGGLLKT